MSEHVQKSSGVRRLQAFPFLFVIAATSIARADFANVPGVVIDHLAADTRCYVGSPSIVILPSGQYVATHDIFGPGSTSDLTWVFTSSDRGQSWARAAEIKGQWWSTLFVVRGALYLMGVDHQFGRVVIRRSMDGGRTWTAPTNGSSGLLIPRAKYHCAPGAVAIHGGRVWRAIEDASPPGGRPGFQAFVMSAPVVADLLNASSWTVTAAAIPGNWLNGEFDGWLEGNAVDAPDGQMVDILRVNRKTKGETAALVHFADSGRAAHFDPSTDFIDFPGGDTKFTIRRDPKSGLYWSLSNYIPPSQSNSEPGNTRNTLALISSSDLRKWTVQCILLFHPDRNRYAFQYVDWQFDGDDLIAVSRTAFDDGVGGAHTFHDANFLTFHRFKNFRALTMKDSVPIDAADSIHEETSDLIVTGTGFQRVTLNNGTRAFANRDYTWLAVPQNFQGGWVTQTSGGERAVINVQAKRDVTLYAATASSQSGIDLTGWNRVQDMSLAYSDRLQTGMDIYAMHLAADAKVSLPQGNWSGMILLVRPEGAGTQPAGSPD